MDAYSLSVHSPTQKKTARIYQDLTSSVHYRHTGFGDDRRFDKLDIMGSLNKSTTRPAENVPHIAVIGGGLAGLRCADVLLQDGLQVTIVEGRNRLGGRVHQERLPNGHLVDLGPNWIHGTANNPIFDLAKLTGTTIGRWDVHSHVFDEDGNLFSVEEGERHADVMWAIVAKAFRYSEENSPNIDPGESLYDFFVREVAAMIPETEKDYERERKLVMQTAQQWGAFIGSPIEQQSLRFFWLEECIEGDNLFVASSYQKILERVARRPRAEALIRYNTKAVRILTRKQPGEKVKVVVESGEVLEFDEVVLTAPLGWLKQNLGAFEPALPRSLAGAIKSIGYGCLEKVYVSFPKAFWLVPDAKGRVVQGFCQWLEPSYAPTTNWARWNQEAVELASLSPEHAHPTLLFYVYGDCSRHLTSQLAALSAAADADDSTGSARQDARDKFLASFFSPYYSRLPHYDASSADCVPTSFLATSWLTDDLAGNGSYCNFPVGLERGDDDIRTMREGLPDRGLWLAGEHTAPFVGLGTATGAYWSGESVARRIAEAYGLARRR